VLGRDGRDDDEQFDPSRYKGQAIIMTHHGAKGLEWDRVYLMSEALGFMPTYFVCINDLVISQVHHEIAELKMLRTLQLRVNHRTKRLGQHRMASRQGGTPLLRRRAQTRGLVVSGSSRWKVSP
jgi:superfamily I DNA/RNA helicase